LGYSWKRNIRLLGGGLGSLGGLNDASQTGKGSRDEILAVALELTLDNLGTSANTLNGVLNKEKQGRNDEQRFGDKKCNNPKIMTNYIFSMIHGYILTSLIRIKITQGKISEEKYARQEMK
jgi:hypothetical protein